MGEPDVDSGEVGVGYNWLAGQLACKRPPIATLAQLVERLIRNQQVAGSIPAGGSNKTQSWLRHIGRGESISGPVSC